MGRNKRNQALGFKYHGVTLERDGTTYQVIHQTTELTYAVPIGLKGLVGGGVERFKR